MKQKLILSLALMTFLIISMGSVLATQTRVSGTANLNWDNAYNRPQQFSGSTTGDLSGTLSLTTNTDYDLSATHVGTTWSEDILLVLDDNTECGGFYAGSTINDGRNVGTFTLSCDNGNMIQGMMHGVNDEFGNINLDYSGFLITPTPGPQGEKGDKGDTGEKGDVGEQGIQGEKGEQGLQGIQGEQGLKGDKGDQGLPGQDGNDGLNGIDGLPGKDGVDGTNGIDGTNGLDGQDGKDGYTPVKGVDYLDGIQGEQGLQGLQGIQGIQGEKGETGLTGSQGEKGEKGDTGACTCDLTEVNKIDAGIFTFFPEFANWFNSQDKCINGQLRCAGDSTQKCVNYNWVTQTICPNGCTDGKCNKENCLTKPTTFSCNSGYSVSNKFTCRYGQGTNTACNFGQCVAQQDWNNYKYCNFGCDSLTGLCKPEPAKEDCTIKPVTYTCSYGHSVKKGYVCQYGQGTNTACYVGKCVSSTISSTHCYHGCDSATGKCL